MSTQPTKNTDGLKVLSLFDGISCGQLALHKANVRCASYHASEIDPSALAITQRNFPDTIQLGDVKHWRQWSVSPDLLLAGSPCQGFSQGGKGLNFRDERSRLFYSFVDALNTLSPAYFLLENTRMKPQWRDIISKELGVAPVLLNSSLVSAQNRERLYWTNIPFTTPLNRGVMLRDIVGPYEGIYVIPRGYNKGGVQSYKGKSPTITTSSWQHNFFISNADGSRRRFTVNECEQIQTLPLHYTAGVADTNRYKAIGNGWTVDLISHIFEGLKPQTGVPTY